MIRRRVAALLATAIAVASPLALSSSADAAQAPCRQNVYGYGGKATCIKALQALISTSATVSYSRPDIGTPIARDGSFGSKTLAAVKKYQRVNGLVVDGRVGPKTWSRLCSTGYYWGDNMKLKADQRWAKSYAC